MSQETPTSSDAIEAGLPSIDEMTAPRDGYEKICRDTKRALAFYRGGEALVEYVPKFSSKEDPAEYGERATAAVGYAFPYVKTIAKQYVEGIFAKGQVKREDTDKAFAAFLTDHYGPTALKEVYPVAPILQEIYTYISVPATPQTNKSKLSEADRKRVQKPPRLRVIYPHKVLNFAADDDGELEWVAIKRKKGVIEIVTRTQVITVREGGEAKERDVRIATHNLGFNPVSRFAIEDDPTCDDETGMAYLGDVVDLAHGNLDACGSGVQAIRVHMTLNFAATKETIIEMMKTGVGNTKVIPLPDDPNLPPPGYIPTPDVEVNVMLGLIFERFPAMIKEAARLQAPASVTTEKSGLALLVESKPAHNAFAALAKWFEKIDTVTGGKMERIFKGLVGKDLGAPTTSTHTYPTTFEVRPLASLLADLVLVVEKLLANPQIPQSKRALLLISQEVYTQLLENRKTDDIVEVLKELDSYKPPEPEPPPTAEEAAPFPPKKEAPMMEAETL